MLRAERRFHDALESIGGFLILLVIILDSIRVIVILPSIYNWREAMLMSGNAGFVETALCELIRWLHELIPYLRLTP